MRHVLIASFVIAAISPLAAAAQGASNSSQAGSHIQASATQSRLEVVRSIAPTGWEGFAKQEVDMLHKSTFSASANEPWESAFARFLSQEGLMGTIDEKSKRYFIDGHTAKPSVIVQTPPIESEAPQHHEAQTVSTSVAPSGYLSLTPGHRLSNQLSEWLNQQGYTLNWEASGSTPGRIRDVIIDNQWSATSEGIHEVLTKVLAPFGFVANVIESQKVIVVRNHSSIQP